MPIDDATWAKVREAYCANDGTVAEVCARFGVPPHLLYSRRAMDGWPLRDPVKSVRIRRSLATGAAPAELLTRLYNAIDTKLTQMENHMEDATASTAADHERDIRAISGLIRNFERVTELNAGLTDPAAFAAGRGIRRSPSPVAAVDPAASVGAASGTGPCSTAAPAGAEQLRRDIAHRLERILGKGNPARDAG